MEPIPSGGPLDLTVALRFVEIATDALASAREEINALNVYPIPDGDTGTNMYLTISAAREAMVLAARGEGADQAPDIGTVLRAFSRGALLGARGNSGVILSEMLRAIADRVAQASHEEPTPRNAVIMAEALHAATEASYACVNKPVEGTILSVAKAASTAALQRAHQDGSRARDVFTDAAEAARTALIATPDQLKALRDAGVVDAGGRGLSVILDAAETALTGRRPMPVNTGLGTHSIPIPQRNPVQAAQDAVLDNDLTAEGPAYEVMYLLDADADAVAMLRETLAKLGDSLVVVGGPQEWHIHVHVDDVGGAIEAGIAAGRPHRVAVTHFAEQNERRADRDRRRTDRERDATRRGERGIVVVAAGPGLESLFASAGASVVSGGPGRRPATAQVLEAINGCGTDEVIVLPNDADSVRTAQLAASTAMSDSGGEIDVAVIETHTQVQGLAALAVHEPGRGFKDDVLEMTATARHVRHGAVTRAARQAMTTAGPCEPGDILGVIAGDFAIVGGDLDKVAQLVIERLLAGGGEMLTLVGGLDDEGLTGRVSEWVEHTHPTVDVVVYEGGQERYPMLMSVE